MNPFITSADRRLELWKHLRESLTPDKDELTQLKMVVKWFAEVPTINYAIDCDDARSWPSPWELISDGYICVNSLAYLMERTLCLCPSRWAADRFQLMLINNREDQILRLCLIVDNQYVLNYANLAIVDWKSICNECQIQAKFKFENNRHVSF